MFRGNRRGSRVIRTLALAGLFVIGLVTGPAASALAGTSGAWSNTGRLNTARSSQTATLLPNGQVLVAGGIDAAGNSLASAELYNPATGAWTVTGSMATARSRHTATLLPNGQVLVAGGVSAVNANGTTTCTAAAELYDPATGRWTTTGSLTEPRGNHAATLLNNGSVLAAGGSCYNGSNNLFDNTAELYNPATGAWKATGSMSIGHAYVAATLLQNGQVLIAGGNTSSSANGRVAELYSNGHWTLTTSMNVLRGGDTATLLNNGNVLVFGGSNLESNATEFYNPATTTWSRTGCYCVNPAIGGQTETLLGSGKVLVAGGKSNYGITNLARLYNSSTNSWASTGGLNTARTLHTAVLLPNGQVLVAGGIDPAGNRLASAELYTP